MAEYPPKSIAPLMQDMERWVNAKDKEFDKSFIQSVLKQYKKKGILSDKQILAMNNIYVKWKVSAWTKKHPKYEDSSDDEPETNIPKKFPEFTD